jgi:hypothetical protein
VSAFERVADSKPDIANSGHFGGANLCSTCGVIRLDRLDLVLVDAQNKIIGGAARFERQGENHGVPDRLHLRRRDPIAPRASRPVDYGQIL